MRPGESWASVGAEELAFRLRAQADCGHPESAMTSGLVAYPRLPRSNRVPCVSRALARAAVDFARQRGARALEGYPMTTKDVLLGELHVGTQGIFAAAGFTEVSRPSRRRVVMRIDVG
jgi:hypothetical protein